MIQQKTRAKLSNIFYTVFVDEYYYSKPPKGQNWGNDATTYWRHFANAADRYIMLVYAPKYSTDNESSYAKARYMLTQRSIQTYYSKESGTALGMEHINETGAATIWGKLYGCCLLQWFMEYLAVFKKIITLGIVMSLVPVGIKI